MIGHLDLRGAAIVALAILAAIAGTVACRRSQNDQTTKSEGDE